MTLKGNGLGMGFTQSGRLAKMTSTPARLCGTPSHQPNRFRMSQLKASRITPVAAISSTKVLNIIFLHDGCYHHRCGRFLSFVVAGLKRRRTAGSNSSNTKHWMQLVLVHKSRSRVVANTFHYSLVSSVLTTGVSPRAEKGWKAVVRCPPFQWPLCAGSGLCRAAAEHYR